ncbi:PE family protein [Nocardia sp. CA-107356]|uniref:PE family protein n=1 Tax=Nocardia sp. CA-107356 TaxID=3239972 RepID=UPI003D932BA6
MSEGVQFDSAATGRAATGLDALADRLAADLSAAEPALTVEPAGADEVSVRAAQTGNDVATSYLAGAQASVHEMRKLAATLRLNAHQIGRMEAHNAADLGSVDGSA